MTQIAERIEIIEIKRYNKTKTNKFNINMNLASGSKKPNGANPLVARD